nr:DMT family transporter [Actibacterium lipolyticum]
MNGLSAAQKGHLAMLSFSFLVGGSFSFGSLIANKIDPVALTAVRFSIATVIIGIAALMGSGMKRSYYRAPWRYIVLGGLFASYFVLMFEGLKTASPVSTAAVFTLTPVLSAIFGWLLMRQATTQRMVVALVFGGVGALWVIFRADLSAFLAFEIGRGEKVFFVGCVAHAIFTPLVARFNRGEPALAFNFGVMSAMVLLLLVFGGSAVLSADWGSLLLTDWLIIAYLIIFASTVTFLLLRFASLRLPSAKVMAYTYLTPSWVIGWEVLLGNGAPQPMIFVGVGVTMVALWMLLKNEHAA